MPEEEFGKGLFFTSGHFHSFIFHPDKFSSTNLFSLNSQNFATLKFDFAYLLNFSLSFHNHSEA